MIKKNKSLFDLGSSILNIGIDKAMELSKPILEPTLNKTFDSIKSLLENSISMLPEETQENIKKIIYYAILKILLYISLTLSPLKFDIINNNNKTLLKISEEELNNYVIKKINLPKEIKSLNLKILEKNIIEINFEIEKLFIKTKVSKKVIVDNFVINKNEAFTKIKVLDNLELEGKNFITKVILNIIGALIENSFEKKFLNTIKENQIFIDEKNVLNINLKETFLKEYYEKKVFDVISKDNLNIKEYLSEDTKHIPFIDSLSEPIKDLLIKKLEDNYLIDFFEIKDFKTEHKFIIINFDFNLPKDLNIFNKTLD